MLTTPNPFTNDNYPFVRPTQFNYAPRSQMGLYSPNGRLNGAQNKQYNRPMDHTNLYSNYNINNVQKVNNVMTGQDNSGNGNVESNVAGSSGDDNNNADNNNAKSLVRNNSKEADGTAEKPITSNLSTSSLTNH
ncbi:3062_t:CDS:1 [Entrophospora sp. SA101]|nr:12606_t:CDS:1 [Entrophospora sp. SA101]CAJ0748057.1 3062_t:CDS:1 [Entrophospora sp. SA101]CAJ0840229.1 16958_t:CDS:1 [Entrophospora sp. SA101]